MDWKESYQSWRTFNQLDETMKDQLSELEKDQDQLEDAFYKSLDFGTAGMRGILGPGTNRMNIYTIRQASQGLADYLLDRFEDAKERGVAIGYDSRYQSQNFAYEAAKTLGQNGIKAYVFGELCPTPVLSFAVRHFKARAGIMITASHNPPNYNGFKVYGDDGAQLLPEAANQLTECVNKVEKPLEIEVADKASLMVDDLLEVVGHRVEKAYLDYMRSVSLNPDLIDDNSTDLKIVFTPLHGTGQKIGKKSLYNAGFVNVFDVPSQQEPDPAFSTVETPNPDKEDAFEEAIKVGIEKDADILIATDPDADRLGVAVKTIPGTYSILTGNEIASLLTDYILNSQFKNDLLPKFPVVVKSIVSSELPARIADSYGARVEDVLTGFKYIAERIQYHEESSETTFMFGFEESNGYLSRPFVRDKDAIQALVLIAEVALYYKLQNFTLVDALFNLYNHYGQFKDKIFSITLEGKKGQEKIEEILQIFREKAPQSFGSQMVRVTEDFLTSERTYSDGSSEKIDLPKSNVLKYKMTDGTWLAVRPSGTEPKIKFYLSATDGSKLEVDRKLEELESVIRKLIEEKV